MSRVATLQRVSGAAWFVAALLSAPATSLAEDPQHAQRLWIVAFNVLAPVWASPDWYARLTGHTAMSAMGERSIIHAFPTVGIGTAFLLKYPGYTHGTTVGTVTVEPDQGGAIAGIQQAMGMAGVRRAFACGGTMAFQPPEYGGPGK